MPEFTITNHKYGDIASLSLAGELDAFTAGQVEAALKEAEDEQPPILALDLRQLSFIDSAGIKIVVRADRRARDSDRRFVVVRGPEEVQRIFNLVGLEDLIEIVGDPDELVAG